MYLLVLSALDFIPATHFISSGGGMTTEGMVHWFQHVLNVCLPPTSALLGAVLVCDGLHAHVDPTFLGLCAEHHIGVVLRYPHSSQDTQGEDVYNFRAFKPAYLNAQIDRAAQIAATGRGSGPGQRLSANLLPIDMPACIQGPFAHAFSRERNLLAWAGTGFSPCTRSVFWDIQDEENAASVRRGRLRQPRACPTLTFYARAAEIIPWTLIMPIHTKATQIGSRRPSTRLDYIPATFASSRGAPPVEMCATCCRHELH